MALITVQQIVSAGLPPELTAVNAEDTFANTGKEYIEVLNGSADSIEVTITTPRTVDSLAVAERVVSVGAGVTKKIGPFPTRTYASDGITTCLLYTSPSPRDRS